MAKILLIANYKPSVGGISGQIEILLKHFNDNKNQIDLFNTKDNIFKRILMPFVLFIKGRKYDIFHIHGCSFFGFFPIVIGVIIGSLLKKKIIITYHGGGLDEFINKYKTKVMYYLNKADIITVPSKYLQNILNDNSIKSKYLPNIIRDDNVYFKKRDILKPNLIVTRTLDEVYNIPLVIMTFKDLKKVVPDAKLKIVGDGKLKNEIFELVKKENIDDIEFVGRVPNSKIGEILNTSDIFINPSNKDNMPLSLFEALACGLAVISTNVGGIPDYITDGINGFLIEPNNKEQLTNKILYVLNNQAEVQKIIDNGYQTFEKLTLRNLKSEYLKLYEL
ncbi:MAG TPA: glycosyltransferase family 4 protein [Ignavibacteriales bacterium]|nr:glycosyltransferase family 4 protein [Ignavibacteriales bacterium]